MYHKRHVVLLALVALLGLLGPATVSSQAGIGRLSIPRVDTVANTAASPPQVEVNLYLNVTDLDGQPLTGLEQGDFTLYENDVPISDFSLEAVEHPMLIGIVIDSAVSFKSREGGAPRVDQAKEAAHLLVAPDYQRLTADDEIAIFAFQDGQPVRLVDFTYDHQLVLDQGILPVSTAGNQYTALFDILRQAVVETAARRGVRRRALLVFSDGIDKPGRSFRRLGVLGAGVDVD